MKTTKIARFKTKDIKYTQTEFAFVEHVEVNRTLGPEYIPPKPNEMTNEELEKWYITNPSKKLKSEILARINKGVKFTRFRVVQYLGQAPQLILFFRDEVM